MKLVMEHAHVSQVTMQVGNVELPLTREQVVHMLFGDEFEITAKGKPKRSPRVFKSGKPVGRPRKEKSEAKPTGMNPQERGLALAKRAALRKKKGICMHCDKKAIKGGTWCRSHNDKMIAARASRLSVIAKKKKRPSLIMNAPPFLKTNGKSNGAAHAS